MFGLCNTTKNYGTKIIDIINMATGKTLDNTNLNTKLDWNLNFLQYLSLRNIVNTSTFFFFFHFLLFPIFVITIYTIHNVVHSIRQSYNSRLKENLNQIIGLINM